MESITVVEETLGWLIRGFPFWFQLFVVWLVSSRLLLKDYGAERLVWEENWRIQLGSLFAIGLLVGTSLYTWFLLDQPERSITFFRELLPTWSLFSTDELNPMTRPGRFLLFGMLGFGMVLFAAKFVALVRVWRRASADRRNGYPAASAYARARWWLLPGLIGYALAFGFPIGLYHLDQACGIRPIIVKQLEKMPGSEAFKPFEAVAARPPIDKPIIKRSEYRPEPSPFVEHHVVAAYLVAVNGTLIALSVLAYFSLKRFLPRRLVAGPVFLASLVAIFADQVYGFLVFNVPFAFTILGVVILLLTLMNLPRIRPFKYRIPGLEKHYAAPVACSHDGRPDLLDDAGTLLNHLAELKRRDPDLKKPRLLVIVASGGGIRSAVWTSLVLERLPERVRARVRLITGASGGMVGAAAAVGCWTRLGTKEFQAEDPADHLRLVSRMTAVSVLAPVVQTMIVRDWLWNLSPFPRWFRRERSRELERQWELAADAMLGHDAELNPFRTTFGSLRDEESKGRVPSLIFTPTSIEDTRKVFISNLDLAALAVPKNAAGEPEIINGLELFRLFPEARAEFKLGTAARINAAFPFISAAAVLPTKPIRRLMDAGFGDNYGIEVAADWLRVHRKTLLAQTSGVAILEIRAFPLEKDGLKLDDEAAWGLKDLAGIAATLADPITASLRGRRNNNYRRNVAAVKSLRELFRTASSPDFFATFPLELDTDASLNWYLSSVERANIGGQHPQADAVINEVQAWLNQPLHTEADTPLPVTQVGIVETPRSTPTNPRP